MAGIAGWDEHDLAALEILQPLLRAGGYLPWTEGALRPAALMVVANEIVLGERRQVAELGAGVSTIVLARLMRERGGHLTTLEHDTDWARVVRSQIELEDLTSHCRLLEAPLEPHDHSLDGAPWYAATAVGQIPEAVDLLLVDGPPGYGDGMATSRYPALPALGDKLARGALVVLDDAAREPEQRILAEWRRAAPEWEFATYPEGIAVGRASA